MSDVLRQLDWVTPESAISTSFAGASHVNRTPSRDTAKAARTTATSGRRCAELLHKSNPLGFLARTLLASSRWHSTLCSLIWKASSTPRSRLLFRLVPSMRATEETGSGSSAAQQSGERSSGTTTDDIAAYVTRDGLLPTPTAVSYGTNQGGAMGRTGKVRPSLQTMAQNGLWPTPTGQDGENKGGPSQYHRHSLSLNAAANIWPTPRASEWKGTGPLGSGSQEHRLKRGYLDATVQHVEQRNGALNPEFVEWLMGYPVGYTALSPSVMRWCRSSLRKSDSPSSRRSTANDS